MSAFTYDLHVHSCLSPCGDADMTPNNIAGMAHLNGLDIVALTDHNACDNCPAFFEACKAYGIVPIAGMELTTSEDIHLVCLFEELEAALRFAKDLQPYRMKIKNRVEIFGEQTILDGKDEPVGEEPYFLPAATMLDLQSAQETVLAHGGVCYPAHIDRESNGLLAILGAFPPEPGFAFAELNDPQRTELAEGRKVLFCSDAHRLWDISEGGNTLELDAERTDATAVRSALFRYLRGEG